MSWPDLCCWAQTLLRVLGGTGLLYKGDAPLLLIDAGGMGEVYRATDTKLGRDVALKVLPAEMASSPDRASPRWPKVASLMNLPGSRHP